MEPELSFEYQPIVIAIDKANIKEDLFFLLFFFFKGKETKLVLCIGGEY